MIVIAKIRNLEIPEPLGDGFEIRDGCFLINDSNRIAALFPAGSDAILGKQFMTEMTNGPVIYCQIAHPDNYISVADPEDILLTWLYDLSTFFQAMWLVGDHAISAQLAFAIFKDPQKGIGSTWNMGIGPTTADGLNPLSSCSVEALTLGRNFYSSLHHFTFNEQWGQPGSVDYKFGSKKGIPRILRFHDFLSSARHANDVAIKISLYMTCLEILFSTSAAELVHKLSERVAYFLAETPSQRKPIFQIIKRAYSIRSKVVHGDVLESSNKIQTASKEVDNLLRQLLLKILTDEKLEKTFQKPPEILEDYLTDLTLGVSNAS